MSMTEVFYKNQVLHKSLQDLIARFDRRMKNDNQITNGVLTDLGVVHI